MSKRVLFPFTCEFENICNQLYAPNPAFVDFIARKKDWQTDVVMQLCSCNPSDVQIDGSLRRFQLWEDLYWLERSERQKAKPGHDFMVMLPYFHRCPLRSSCGEMTKQMNIFFLIDPNNVATWSIKSGLWLMKTGTWILL